MGRISVYIKPAAMNMTAKTLEHSIHYSDDNSVFVFRVVFLNGVDLIVISKRIGHTDTWSVSIFGKEVLIPCVEYLVYDFDIVGVDGRGITLDVARQTGATYEPVGRLVLYVDGSAEFDGIRIETSKARRFQTKAAVMFGGNCNEPVGSSEPI